MISNMIVVLNTFMSLFGGIVGGFVGFTLLGPIGALVGSVVGSRISENRTRRRNPNNFDHQVAFFAALFACFGGAAPPGFRSTQLSSTQLMSPPRLACRMPGPPDRP